MISETRIGRMRTGDAHSQGGKSINHILNNLPFSIKSSLAFLA